MSTRNSKHHWPPCPSFAAARYLAILGHHIGSNGPKVRFRPPRPLPNQHDRQQQEHQQRYNHCLAPVVSQDFGECAGQRRPRGSRCEPASLPWAPGWAPGSALADALERAGISARRAGSVPTPALAPERSVPAEPSVQVFHPEPRPPEPAPRDPGPRAIGPDRPRLRRFQPAEHFRGVGADARRSSRAGPPPTALRRGGQPSPARPSRRAVPTSSVGRPGALPACRWPKAYRWPPTPRPPPVGPGGRRC